MRIGDVGGDHPDSATVLLKQSVDALLDGFTGRSTASQHHVAGAVRELLDDLPRYRARVQAVRNRAVFEVPQILQDIVRARQTASRG